MENLEALNKNHKRKSMLNENNHSRIQAPITNNYFRKIHTDHYKYVKNKDNLSIFEVV